MTTGRYDVMVELLCSDLSQLAELVERDAITNPRTDVGADSWQRHARLADAARRRHPRPAIERHPGTHQ